MYMRVYHHFLFSDYNHGYGEVVILLWPPLLEMYASHSGKMLGAVHKLRTVYWVGVGGGELSQNNFLLKIFSCL